MQRPSFVTPETATAAAVGIAAGSGLTYLLDPNLGRRRRAILRDKVMHAAHHAVDEGEAAARDMQHRTAGYGARLTRPLRRGRQPTTPQLEGRVRSELGRWTSHAHALRVDARDGTITLSGPVLRDEVDDIRAAVKRVRGVDALEDRLAIYDDARDIPALHDGNGSSNGRARTKPRPEYLQDVWAPSARFVALASGAGATAWGLTRRSPAGLAVATAGGLFAARAATNQPLSELTGIGAGRGAVTVHKTITIDAPVDEVYALWSLPSSFPLFMRNVYEVREGQDRHTRWAVRGPLGTTLRFETEITAQEPDRLISWTTMPGAGIQHAGRVTFEPTDGATRVIVRLTYNPVLGRIGHAVARLTGRAPKRLLDQDLMRMKAYLETGTRPHDAAVPA